VGIRRWPRGTWMRLEDPEKLRAGMKLRGVSHRDLARMADCTKGTVDHLVSGRMRSCTPQLAERIAQALGLPTEMLSFVPKSSVSNGRIARVTRPVRVA
jgi:transcriptional regulator with XRE-family HTH domain